MKKSKISLLLSLLVASTTFALPNLSIYATGGTIAGTSTSSTDTSNYDVAKLSVEKLIAGVPELKTIANVKGYQIANVDSNDMSNDILLELAKKLNSDLAGDTAGAVITHGTDTLEETAFFLSLTTKPDKPIVLVGSMRPSTALSADGYMNLLQAASVAAHEDSKDRGIMVVMNDRIGSGYYITKTNANNPDTFKSIEAGNYGQMIGLTPRFYYQPQVVTNKSSFDVSKFEHLPKVEIIYGYQSTDTSQLDAAIANGAKGVVIAGTGAGSLSVPMIARVKALTAEGFPIVRSTRVINGYVGTPDDEGIASGFLNPQKSRLLLALSLANEDDLPTIRQHFKK